MTEIDYSRILAGFFLAYAIMYAGSGYIVDRLGTKKSFSLFIGVWSLASMLHVFATGVWSFGACRFLLGLGEPGNWPAATKAVSEWFAPKQRALGVGIFNAGSSAGFRALAARRFVADHPLWLAVRLHRGRGPRGSSGCSLVDALRHAAPQQVAAGQRVRGDSKTKFCRRKMADPGPIARAPRRTGATIVRTREAIALCLARTFTDPVIYFVIFWLPAYLVKERGFDQKMIGKYSWVPFIFGGIAYMLGGWLSGWLMGRAGRCRARRKRIMLLGALCLPVAMIAPFVPNAGLAIAAICFHHLRPRLLDGQPADHARGFVPRT